LHCNVQHRFTEIQSSNFRAELGQAKRNVSSATTDIQCAFAGFYIRDLKQSPFPIAMQPETLQVVDEVVAPRNFPK
jgi:hypothetical protein